MEELQKKGREVKGLAMKEVGESENTLVKELLLTWDQPQECAFIF